MSVKVTNIVWVFVVACVSSVVCEIAWNKVYTNRTKVLQEKSNVSSDLRQSASKSKKDASQHKAIFLSKNLDAGLIGNDLQRRQSVVPVSETKREKSTNDSSPPHLDGSSGNVFQIPKQSTDSHFKKSNTALLEMLHKKDGNKPKWTSDTLMRSREDIPVRASDPIHLKQEEPYPFTAFNAELENRHSIKKRQIILKEFNTFASDNIVIKKFVCDIIKFINPNDKIKEDLLYNAIVKRRYEKLINSSSIPDQQKIPLLQKMYTMTGVDNDDSQLKHLDEFLSRWEFDTLKNEIMRPMILQTVGEIITNIGNLDSLFPSTPRLKSNPVLENSKITKWKNRLEKEYIVPINKLLDFWKLSGDPKTEKIPFYYEFWTKHLYDNRTQNLMKRQQLKAQILRLHSTKRAQKQRTEFTDGNSQPSGQVLANIDISNQIITSINNLKKHDKEYEQTENLINRVNEEMHGFLVEKSFDTKFGDFRRRLNNLIKTKYTTIDEMKQKIEKSSIIQTNVYDSLINELRSFIIGTPRPQSNKQVKRDDNNWTEFLRVFREVMGCDLKLTFALQV
jgi:hypothetical protein